MNQLTLFYDGHCPLCSKEMQQLKQHDKNNALLLIDVHSDAFHPFHSISKVDAMNRLHALDEHGNLHLGLDATHQAWSKVGKWWLYGLTRLPGIRFLTNVGYLWFARNRYKISALFFKTKNVECEKCENNRNYKGP
ncbi:DUF393 domain-containing protein [Vibrio sp. FNV 38]|nr:DUF393 domain-containing protein [Vibrio sp. FNV 38]